MAKQDTDNGENWQMPEPIFRSSEGHKPGTAPPDPQADIPTEPGFTPDETGDPVAGVQTVRPSTKTRIRHKKKAAPSNSMRTTIIVIVVSVIVLITSLIYLLFFYRPIGR